VVACRRFRPHPKWVAPTLLRKILSSERTLKHSSAIKEPSNESRLGSPRLAFRPAETKYGIGSQAEAEVTRGVEAADSTVGGGENGTINRPNR
jgi:hypothetical protein